MGRRLLVVLGGAALAACAARAPRRPTTSPWSEALATAQLEVAAGRFGAADSVLASFAANNPASADTAEALFWRALFLADPTNPADSTSTAVVAFIDRFLAAQPAPPRRYEAELIRRYALIRATPPEVRVDTVATLDTATLRATVAREVGARDRVRDEEAQRLRDSLDRTTAELDRIRRRLSPGRP
jgi:hypothetical protein